MSLAHRSNRSIRHAVVVDTDRLKYQMSMLPLTGSMIHAWLKRSLREFSRLSPDHPSGGIPVPEIDIVMRDVSTETTHAQRLIEASQMIRAERATQFKVHMQTVTSVIVTMRNAQIIKTASLDDTLKNDNLVTVVVTGDGICATPFRTLSFSLDLDLPSTVVTSTSTMMMIPLSTDTSGDISAINTQGFDDVPNHSMTADDIDDDIDMMMSGSVVL